MALLFGPLTIGIKLQEWKRFMYEISTFDVSKTHARNKTSFLFAHLYLKVENTRKERHKYMNVRVSNSFWSLQIYHYLPKSYSKRQSHVNQIIIMVTENKENQSLFRAQLMLCKSWHLVHDQSRCHKKRNIDWPILFRKVLVSKEIQQICAKMSS